MPDTEEKTEEPTPRRRAEAREEGNVPRSQDFSAGIVVLGAVLLLGAFGPQMLGGLKLLVRSQLSGEWSMDEVLVGDGGHLWAVAFTIGTRVALPLLLGLFALAIASNVVQFGFLITLKPLAPKISKLSPLKGAKNLFSMRSTVRLVMSLAKVAVVLAVAGVSIYLDIDKVMSLMRLDAGPMLAAASGLVWWVSLRIALVLLLLGIIDFLYQKWQNEQDLKMSKKEVKEEMKRMEGDPQVKQRRSKVARQLTMQRMGQAVPSADVVVTNPTHYAVALKYNDQMGAPKVVAKGADYMAMRIRQLAVGHGVPIVERPPIARALYRNVEVGHEIPEEFYSAVAEILAYVYQLEKAPQPA